MILHKEQWQEMNPNDFKAINLSARSKDGIVINRSAGVGNNHKFARLGSYIFFFYGLGIFNKQTQKYSKGC